MNKLLVELPTTFWHTDTSWRKITPFLCVRNTGERSDYIFYSNTAAGLTAAFLLLRVWLNAKYPSTENMGGNKPFSKIRESTKRQLYAVAGLTVIAAGLIMLYHRSTHRGIELSSILSSTNTIKSLPIPSSRNDKSYTFRGMFQDAYLGDLYHLIFIDENNREWDFGQASNNNNLGTFQLDMNERGNPRYKGKWFLVTYDSIRTKVFAGEDDAEGYMETIPRIVKLEMAELLQAPLQLSPTDGTVFNHYPRHTTVSWRSIPGDVKYSVEIDVYTNLGWAADHGQRGKIVSGISDTSYTFEFVGAQPGRWRVWAVDSKGSQSATSSWWYFRYTQ